MRTEKLLEDLEVLIESSSRIPMTTKRMVEEDEIMRIIDSIQESLPLELEESRRIVADKDKVLADAQRQAETLIDQAKDYIAQYAGDVLKYVENNLEKTLESLRQNRESLKQTEQRTEENQ